MTSFFRDDWPIEAQREIKRLRSECARYRIARNEARQELAELKRRLQPEARPEGLLTPAQTLSALDRGRF